MKLLLFSDVHIGTSSQSTTNPGIIRLASSQASTTLQKSITSWNKTNYDLIFQMGDIIREVSDQSANIQHISKAVEVFSTIDHPLVHILGNHDIRATSKSEISDIFGSHKLNPQFFGSKTISGYRCIWLDSELDENKRGFIPDEQLSWLSTQLKEAIPTFIFSHHSIIPQSAQSNFYFENTGNDMVYTNSDALLEIIKNSSVKACINAHCHWLSYKKVEGIHFITIPAFSENVAGMDYPENNPGVYSTLEVAEGKMLFKSYSGQFAFVNLELEI